MLHVHGSILIVLENSLVNYFMEGEELISRHRFCLIDRPIKTLTTDTDFFHRWIKRSSNLSRIYWKIYMVHDLWAFPSL